MSHIARSSTQTRNNAATNVTPTEPKPGRISANDNKLIRVERSVRSVNKAPTTDVLVTGLNGSKILEALPDSGADLTAADVNILSELNEYVENLLQPSHGETSSVDGSFLREIGKLPVKITLGETTVDEIIHVFPSIPGGLLVSWKTAKELKILPKDYPQQIQSIRKSLQKRTLAKKTLSMSFRLSLTVKYGQWNVKNFVLS